MLKKGVKRWNERAAAARAALRDYTLKQQQPQPQPQQVQCPRAATDTVVDPDTCTCRECKQQQPQPQEVQCPHTATYKVGDPTAGTMGGNGAWKRVCRACLQTVGGGVYRQYQTDGTEIW